MKDLLIEEHNSEMERIEKRVNELKMVSNTDDKKTMKALEHEPLNNKLEYIKALYFEYDEKIVEMTKEQQSYECCCGETKALDKTLETYTDENLQTFDDLNKAALDLIEVKYKLFFKSVMKKIKEDKIL